MRGVSLTNCCGRARHPASRLLFLPRLPAQIRPAKYFLHELPGQDGTGKIEEFFFAIPGVVKHFLRRRQQLQVGRAAAHLAHMLLTFCATSAALPGSYRRALIAAWASARTAASMADASTATTLVGMLPTNPRRTSHESATLLRSNHFVIACSLNFHTLVRRRPTAASLHVIPVPANNGTWFALATS